MPGAATALPDVAHACLGISLLGTCNYNPSSPSSIYFSLGEVIGALAFTLAVQQLLKPIYHFRLAARHLTLKRLYLCVFAGLLAVLIATLVPQLPFLHDWIWGYAIFWEFVATLLFACSYGAVALSIVQPVRVGTRNLIDFCRLSAHLLSSANETDHLDYFADFDRSLPPLIDAARFGERLQNTSAFFDFIYRRQLERAAYASSFLRIIADPSFCETLVKRSPWRVVAMLQTISTKRLHCRSAETFVRELAYQAILRDDGMMAREVGYQGFGTAPVLSESLFADPFILNQYNPMDWLHSLDIDALTSKAIRRFNSAAERCFTTVIEENNVWESRVAFTIERHYESIFMVAWKLQETKDAGFHVPLEIHSSVTLAIRMAEKLLTSVDAQQYSSFFVIDPKKYQSDVLESLVEIPFKALESISNRFKGINDIFWTTAISTLHKAFPAFGSEPDGMSPFQQRLAIKIIDKLQDNMKGYYPAISRVLLACIGPYTEETSQKNPTAFNLLKRAVYAELKKLPDLARNKPDKLQDFFPDNVAFDVAASTLTHTYRGGSQTVTQLDAIQVAAPSLLSEDIRQVSPRLEKQNGQA